MEKKTSFEMEVLKKIRNQVDPNLRIQKQLRLLKYFWIISSLLLFSFIYCLYAYPELNKQLEAHYGVLMLLPTLFVVVLIILGYQVQTVKIMEFKNKSKFRGE